MKSAESEVFPAKIGWSHYPTGLAGPQPLKLEYHRIESKFMNKYYIKVEEHLILLILDHFYNIFNQYSLNYLTKTNLAKCSIFYIFALFSKSIEFTEKYSLWLESAKKTTFFRFWSCFSIFKICHFRKNAHFLISKQKSELIVQNCWKMPKSPKIGGNKPLFPSGNNDVGEVGNTHWKQLASKSTRTPDNMSLTFT